MGTWDQAGGSTDGLPTVACVEEAAAADDADEKAADDVDKEAALLGLLFCSLLVGVVGSYLPGYFNVSIRYP